MNRYVYRMAIALLCLTACLVILSVNPVFASENAQGWRPTYDLIMRWVNFLILAFLLFKLLKNPLKDYLSNTRDEIAIQIKRLEQEKEAATQRVNETLKEIEDSETRIEEIKERIIRQGENKKQELINDAELQTRIIMDDAKRKINYKILKAKNRLRDEMVDIAVDIAIQELPDHITGDDRQKFIDQYLDAATPE